jgi:hypothetical protein
MSYISTHTQSHWVGPLPRWEPRTGQPMRPPGRLWLGPQRSVRWRGFSAKAHHWGCTSSPPDFGKSEKGYNRYHSLVNSFQTCCWILMCKCIYRNDKYSCYLLQHYNIFVTCKHYGIYWSIGYLSSL